MVKMTYEINPNWSDYDKAVAQCQLKAFGIIRLDEYGKPIELERILEEIM